MTTQPSDAPTGGRGGAVGNRPGPKRGYRQSPEHAAKRGAARKFWTGERLWAVMGYVDQGLDDAQIAELMGVTAEAIRIIRVRNNIRCVRSHYRSARDVARTLGVHDKAVCTWIDRGFLRAKLGKPSGGWKPQWYIRPRAVERFLHDERYWHIWRPERITDAALRERMTELRGHVRYLTPGEVAHRLYVTTNAVNHWINKGWLPARKWGNWWILESDLETFELPRIGGPRGPRKQAA